MHNRLKIISLLLLSFLVLQAQEKRPMTFIDLLEVPALSEARLSYDGTQIVFTKSRADWDKNKHLRHIWRVDKSGNNLSQFSNGSGGERSPIWSPDDKQIAFIDKRDGDKNSQIYLIHVTGGEARRFSDHKTSVSSVSWSPDGKYIYFTALDEKTKQEKEDEKNKNDVYAFEGNLKQRHLWRISLAEGKEERITDGNFSVLSYKLSRDGAYIVFTRAKSRVRDDADYNEIWVMDADGRNMKQITHNRVSERNGEMSPDNSKVLFISWCNEKFEPYYNNNLFVANLQDGQIKMLLADMPYEVQRAHWSSDGKAIYFTANMGVHSELFKVDVQSEKLTQLTEGEHAIRSWYYNPGMDIHLLQIDEPHNPGDLWLLQPKAGKKLKRITHIYDYLKETFKLPRQEVIRWKGQDGVTVEGILVYPLDYQKGKRYPLAVLTHGGPRASDKFGFGRWRTYLPVMAARGYAVLKPNYRGSTGYGDAFLRDMVGHYFHQSHLDVMSGVDYLIDQGIADPERLLKAGWSAGGHMTNKIITFTNRFKAASSGAGAVNWISMYGQSDTRNQRTAWFGGTPWQKDAPIENYWNSSPLKDISKVTTPTIIFVGEKDPRVPMPQSVELYRALKSNGVPTVLYVAPREQHGWRELRHQLFKMNAELAWFEKYVMDREFEWEKAPQKKKESD